MILNAKSLWVSIMITSLVAGDISTEMADFVKENYRKPVVRVIGGKDAIDGRFTFAQISLLFDSSNSHQCGASLVAPDMILTAAHCMQYFDTVHFDRHDFGDIFDRFQVLKPINTIVHHRYNSATFDFDFALIHLDEAIPNATPVRINDNPSIPRKGQTLKVLGWGAINNDFDNPIYPDVLQIGSVEYIPSGLCENIRVEGSTPYKGEIFDTMLCAGREQVDACSGDSGGPLVLQGAREGEDLLVGLVSWGRGCAILPGVYSRVSHQYHWIRSNICYWSESPPPYLECKIGERSPIYTKAPSPAPSLQPTALTSAVPSHHIESNAREFQPVEAVVTIQLDERSSEVGWFLANKYGQRIIDVPVGTYKASNALVQTKVSLIPGSEYLLVLKDTGGDGICCDWGEPGWYEVAIEGVGESGSIILHEEGHFGIRTAHFFFLDPQAVPKKSILPPSSADVYIEDRFEEGSHKGRMMSSKATTTTYANRSAITVSLLALLLVIG